MNDDDFIMLDARIDGLREAIAVLVRSLTHTGAAIEALRKLERELDTRPAHIGAKQQVSLLVSSLTNLRASDEPVEGDDKRHGEARASRDVISR